MKDVLFFAVYLLVVCLGKEVEQEEELLLLCFKLIANCINFAVMKQLKLFHF